MHVTISKEASRGPIYPSGTTVRESCSYRPTAGTFSLLGGFRAWYRWDWEHAMRSDDDVSTIGHFLLVEAPGGRTSRRHHLGPAPARGPFCANAAPARITRDSDAPV